MVDSYIPKVEEIIAVTKGKTTIVQTARDHFYIPGNTVRFFIPDALFGMIQLSGKTGKILSVTDDTLTVDINSNSFAAFTLPVSYFTPAQVIPLGDVNTGFIGPDANDPLGIPGSFRIT